jgi:hypothetical protein
VITNSLIAHCSFYHAAIANKSKESTIASRTHNRATSTFTIYHASIQASVSSTPTHTHIPIAYSCMQIRHRSCMQIRHRPCMQIRHRRLATCRTAHRPSLYKDACMPRYAPHRPSIRPQRCHWRQTSKLVAHPHFLAYKKARWVALPQQ